MDEILKQIHYYAQQLKGINMWQAAGDYDYISSFLDSPRWNDGEYYGVVPRGENTIDEYSHNCPIPFTANRCLVSRCYDNDKALEILNKLSELFNTLKSDVSGDGLTAINAYIENTNLYIELLGGEPVPPGPEPPVYDTYYAGGIISPDASIDFVVTKSDKTFFTVDNISLTGFMVPMYVENTFYGNQTITSQSVVINNNDVDGILYDADGEPVTDQTKLYGIIRLEGTGTGSIPVSVEENGWFKADHSTKSNISDMSWYSMYGDDGQPLLYDSLATYSVTKAYLNDSEVTIIQYGRIYDDNGYCILNIGLGGNSATKVIIQKISSQSFTTLDTLRQMGLVSTYFDSQGRLRLKFSCAGTGIAFTGTMDSVNVIVANKQQMTVDNINIYSAPTIMPGVMEKYEPMPRVFVLVPKSKSNTFSGYDTVVEACNLNGNSIPYSAVSSYIENNTSMICNCFNKYVYGFVDTNKSVKYCITNNNGNVAWKSTYYYQNDVCYSCAFISDMTDVSVVDVFESNAPYRCFKAFYYNNKYYVLDEIQLNWVDDLSKLGYQTTPKDNVAYPYGAYFLHNMQIGYNQLASVKTWNNTGIQYNDGLNYQCTAYALDGTLVDNVEFYRYTNAYLYMRNAGSPANIYSASYSTSNKLPDVVKYNKRTLSGKSTAQQVTIAPNAVSRWIRELVQQSTHAGFTPAVINVLDDLDNVVTRSGVTAVFDNTDGGVGTYSQYNISIRNDTQYDLNCTYANVALCKSNMITVVIITVYDSSNNTYNAFKYTLDGTDYYYVLDNIQTDWTDNLSSIGYHVPPALPMVTTVNGIVGDATSYGSRYIAAGGSVYPWVLVDGVRVILTVSEGTVVAFVQISNGSGQNIMHTGFSVERQSTGDVMLTNNTGSSYSGAFGVTVAYCLDSASFVIQVYNSSNNPYNAFKYTSDGTDYYYVLDGTQTDWTDDLSSIGYKLPMVGWMKADHTIKSFISEIEWYDLYDDDGQLITSGFPDPFTSHSFIVINAYRGNDVVTCTFNQFGISTGHLKVNMDVVGQSVQYITYMETPTT